MLRSLIVENFKAFGRRQEVPLAPITLIFGENSGGKSSILQSLLMLKQTVAAADSSDTLLLPKGNLVDLGSFREMLFQHNDKLTCEVTPMFDMDKNLVSEELGPRPRPSLSILEALNGPLGIGLRTRYDSSARTVRLVQLPVYWQDAQSPAYALLPADSGASSATARPTVKLGHVNAEHMMWSSLAQRFEVEALPRTLKRLRTLLASIDKTVSSGMHGSEMFEQPQLFSRAGNEVQREQARLSRFEAITLLYQLSRLGLETFAGQPEYRAMMANTRNEIQSFIDRYSSYNLDFFVADIQEGSSDRNIELRNFILDKEVRSRQERRRGFDTLGRSVLEDRTGIFAGLPDLTALSIALSSQLRRLLDRTVYLGPLREHPERHYIYSGAPTREVGKSGSRLPDLLFHRRDLVMQTNRRLESFGLGYELDVQGVDDRNVEDVFALRLKDKRTNTTVSMLDVGFGISQVLPVIVQSTLSRGQLILIEQPEIHLHPKLQAELGQLFKDCIAEPQGNQFIIETHSEHLILRLQRLIRKGDLKPTDVSVIYVLRDDSGSHCLPLRLDEDGDFIDEWPHGFFEEDYEELFAER